MSEMFATRFETSDLTAAVNLFTESRRVVGVIVANTTAAAATVAFTTADGATTAMFTVRVDAESTVDMDVPFIADNGLRANTAAGVGVIVSALTGAAGA